MHLSIKKSNIFGGGGSIEVRGLPEVHGTRPPKTMRNSKVFGGGDSVEVALLAEVQGARLTKTMKSLVFGGREIGLGDTN